jgi:hypothetical protein
MKLSDLDDGYIIEHLATKEDLLSLEVKLTNLILGVSSAFHKEVVGLLQWLVVIGLGASTIILGGVYFMLAHFRP